MATVQPAERQDIHKSCRTVETLSSALNDYCEAAGAFAAIQKKLAKALRDAAGLKTNVQSAANAFGASSSVLEALADVDGKFAKLASKESHSVGAEVKKWLKKLAKEEKAHDERMNESNARIKEAGQAYEKKSKKGAKDANEEHARYINLLSVIGPEMSQEKFKHAVHVTHQNTMVTFSVAASLSRIADAEWSRTCECMRRISPIIGSLGEWRSLCEGAWTGPLPDDLPDVSSETSAPQASVAPAVSEWGQTGLATPARRMLPIPPSHSPGSASAPTTTSLDPPRSPFSAPSHNQGSINSITTLSAFPFPPTHFPVPLAMSELELQRQQAQLQSLQAVHSRAGSPNPTQSNGVLAPPAPILSDSPKHMTPTNLPGSLPSDASGTLPHSQVSQTPASSHPFLAAEAVSRPELSTLDTIKPMTSGGDPKKPRRPSLIARKPPPSDKLVRPVSPFKRAEYSPAEKEFGVHLDSSRSGLQSQSVDSAKKNLERADSTHSVRANVAALRNRYTQTVETPSQGPKDIPRLQMSVSEMASRYQPADEPLSPRRTVSPVVDRFPPDTPTRTSARDTSVDENEMRRRRQRIEELAELELRETEYDLRKRERELDQRSRDFERDRLQFRNSRPEPGNINDGPKGPRNSPFRHKRGSQSVTHINLSSSTSSSSAPSLPRPSASHSPTHSPLLPTKDHAPFCGCDTCSVSKYKVTDISPSPRDLRPPEPPILLRPEKPKGWIRRLSMPSVNAAFSLDAKKNANVLGLKAGLPLPSENGQLRKRSYEQGVSNRTLPGTGR